MLLRDVSGAFRPHQLACLMGASGAGKTTLMDCLAGRKTSKKKKKRKLFAFQQLYREPPNAVARS